ncbi:oligosaccharide flippase family protein [Aliivibrio fischeri]|uniref:oligosaccharide flippase family protein n=1 Tax=Aliivibrio fischeri TaxID=668 RepID=UPI0012D875EC|nr:oligosaccharide flippase family protein [Aliivibrio fischeri]MUK26522.1 oligosaccharide flippase family protein [Aliivibrio fischeri]MUK33716.1 oligosaccharide flippase family protein [Aliivibrio fischeri]
MPQSKNLIFLNVFSGAGKTVIISALAIISIPIALSYWGETTYGFVVLINSLLAYLSMSALGIDAAASILMNKAKTDAIKKNILIRSVKLTVLFVVITLSVFLLIDDIYPDWINIIGDIDSKITLAKQSGFVLILFFILNMVFKLISAGFCGFHKPYYESVFQTFTAIGNFFVLLFVVYFKLSLLDYAYLLGGTNLVQNIIKMVFFYTSTYKRVTICCDSTESDTFGNKKILSLGLQCLLGTVAALIINNTDNIVISKMLGIEQVSTYSVVFKVYTILFSIIFILNSSITPILGKSIADKSIQDVKELYFKTFYLILGFTGFSVGSINFFLPDLLYFWANIEVDYLLICIFSAFAFFFSITNLNNIITNAFNYVSSTIPILIFEAILNIVLSVYLSTVMGVVGVALATLISTFFGSFIFFPIVIYYKTDKKIKFPLKDFLSFFQFIIVPFYTSSILVNLFELNFYLKVCGYLLSVFFYAFFIYRYFPKIEFQRVLKLFLFKQSKKKYK